VGNFINISDNLIKIDTILSAHTISMSYPQYNEGNTMKKDLERLKEDISYYERQIMKCEENIRKKSGQKKTLFSNPQKDIDRLWGEIANFKAKIKSATAEIEKIESSPVENPKYTRTDTAYHTDTPRMTKDFTMETCQLLHITYADFGVTHSLAVTNNIDLILQLNNATAVYDAYKDRYRALKDAGVYIGWVSDSYEDKAIDFYLNLPDFHFVYSEKSLNDLLDEISKA